MVEEVRQELGVGYVCSLGTQSAVSMCAVWGMGGCHILLQHHKMCPLCSLPCPSDEGLGGTHHIHQIQQHDFAPMLNANYYCYHHKGSAISRGETSKILVAFV